MERVLIIGNSGSGKSWLSAHLSTRLDVKKVHLDAIVWELGGYNQKRPQDVVDGELSKLRLEHSWVVEGVFGALAEKLVHSADTLIFLDMDWPLCESSLLSRGSESAKQVNGELAEKNFRELLIWGSEYYTRASKSSYQFHNQLYTQFTGNKFRFSTREQVNNFVTSIAKRGEGCGVLNW